MGRWCEQGRGVLQEKQTTTVKEEEGNCIGVSDNYQLQLSHVRRV
jgi:hypothetical protein